jgi:phage major head subunit gpT-like protein
MAEFETSSIDGLAGHWRNVEANSAGVEGDLHLLPSATHVAEALDASLAAQAAGLAPVVGISHDVVATFRMVESVQEATRIVSVLSADVVADPAAGGRAVRMVAGGITVDDASASPNSPEKEHPDMSLAEILASATDEDKAALRALLGDAPTATTDPDPDDAPSPADAEPELVGAARESLTVRLLVREAMTAAKLDVRHTEAVDALLPERVAESDIARAVDTVNRTVQRVAEGVERGGLTPSSTPDLRVTADERDKARERLYQTLCRNWREGFTSIYAAYEAITGRRLNPYDPDDVRTLVRESWAPSRMGKRVSEAITTSTFGEALGDSVTRRLIDMYSAARYGSWRAIATTVPVRDFRTQRRDRIGGYGNLPTVAEGGAYQPLTSATDEEATYAVTKKGGTESWTFEAAMNDDLGALARIPEELGRAAARTLHEFVWLDCFASNPTCSYDSVALFDAAHANTDAVALSNANASTLRAKMRTQAGYGVASKPLGVTPRYLIVPNELEDLGNQICNGDRAVPATTPGATDVPNLHKGTELIVVDEFTDANDWYMTADPADLPLIEIGFLGGREEPELFMQDDPAQGTPFSSDEVTWKIRHIYSGAVIDHRAAQRGTQ